MGFKLDEEQDLGVIVKKETSGIMVTNKGEKSMTGNIGDTLMMRTNRTTYTLTKEEVAERKAAAKPETAAQKRARLAAEAADNNPANGTGSDAGTGTGNDEKGPGANGESGDAGANGTGSDAGANA